MSLDARQRRVLSTRGRGLKAEVTIVADRVTDAVVDHVRNFLMERELGKVRIRADRREECDRAAAELARRVPCEIVTRIGRVVLLYRPGADPVQTA